MTKIWEFDENNQGPCSSSQNVLRVILIKTYLIMNDKYKQAIKNSMVHK